MRAFSSGPGRIAVGAALTVLVLSGCSGRSSGPGAADTGTPVSGGALTLAADSEPTSWDIHVSAQDITGEIDRNVFDSLVSEDAQGAFHPWLATSWEVSPDSKSYTFHLRQGVTFTDGTPFDAAAVKANFDHVVAKSTKSQLAASFLGPYAGTTVIDPSTVKVSFSQSFAPFLQGASTSYLGFYSPKALAASADSFAAGGPALVGTGPFRFTSYTKGQSAVFTRNPAYQWGPAGASHTGPAYLNTLTVRFLPENSVRVGALTSGQVQVARAIPAQNVTSVEADPKIKVLRQDAPGGNYNLYLNASKAPFDDERVRKAVQRGINIDRDVKVIGFGQFARAWSPLSPTTPFYDKALEKSWPYDPALSNQLLDQAGWTTRDSQGYRTKDGKRLVADWPLPPGGAGRDGRDTLGQAIQADLRTIGVQVTRPTLDIGTFVARAYGGKEDILDFTWARFEPDVLWLFFNSQSTPATGGQNATFLRDSQLDDWTNQARSTLDPAVRKDAYAKTQARAIDLATVVPLYIPATIVGRSTSVHGLGFDSNTWLTLYDTWLAR
jgi:peptide/nickel transport system substrate-binding protein